MFNVAIKKELLDYYDKIRSDIDLRAQIVIQNIDKHIQNNPDIPIDKLNKINAFRAHILQINIDFIGIVQKCCDENLKELNDFKKDDEIINYNYDIIIKKILKHNCIYIEYKKFYSNYPLGVLIYLNWYLTKEEKNFILHFFNFDRESVEKKLGIINIKLDQNLIILVKSISEWSKFQKSQIFEKDYILYFTKQNFIDEIAQQKKFELQIDSQYNLPKNYKIIQIKEDCFINYKSLEEIKINYITPGPFIINGFQGSVCHNLKKLELTNWRSTRKFNFDELNFDCLVNLEQLILKSFKFEQLNHKRFMKLVKLKLLNLSASTINSISTEFFANFPNLQYLNLNRCTIKNLVHTYFQCLNRSLTELNLTSINLTQRKNKDEQFLSIASLFSNIDCLKKLDLDIDLYLINKCNEKLWSNLEELNLDYIHIPNENINNNTNYHEYLFKKLYKKDFGDLKNLKNLRLEFKNAKRTFFKLEMSENVFSDLYNKSQLEKLEISHPNSFNYQSKCFSSLSNLKSLKLDNVRILVLDQNLLAELHSLESLEIIESSIGEIKKDAFKDLIKLKSLDLSKNYLDRINSFTFEHLSNLISLNLFRAMSLRHMYQINDVCDLFDLNAFKFFGNNLIYLNINKIYCLNIDNLDDFKTKFGINKLCQIEYSKEIEQPAHFDPEIRSFYS